MGILTIGADMFRNQLGVIGKNLRKSRKKNRQSWFSSTYEGTEGSGRVITQTKSFDLVKFRKNNCKNKSAVTVKI